jgi:hypothetical protein
MSDYQKINGMKRISLLILLLSTLNLYSQNWNWSKKIYATQTAQEGLLTTSDGRVLVFGSSEKSFFTTSSTSTSGSYLFQYDTLGNLLGSKNWPGYFYIQKVICATDGNLYFAGFYKGSPTVDGISLPASAGFDAMMGCIDVTGNIVWIHTLTSAGPDGFNDLTLGADGLIYAAGAVGGQFTFDTGAMINTPQSALIAYYNTTGVLHGYHLYDRVPEREGSYKDVIREIADDSAGNIYILMQQDGYHWNNPDTVSAPEMGVYVYRLSPTLDTLWSTYVNGPASYYGNTTLGLEAAPDGDPYVNYYNSFKHGGEGYIKRYDRSNGLETWNLRTADATYRSMVIREGLVYVFGIEGAYYCPCPYGKGGHWVIKIIDSFNTTIGESQMTGFRGQKMTVSREGSIYFRSNFADKRKVSYGPNTLIADSTYNYMFHRYDYHAQVLSKLSSLPCQALTMDLDTAFLFTSYYSLCVGTSCTITPSPVLGSFVWNTGETTTAISVNSAGNYSCINTQSNGCVAYSLPLNFQMEVDTALADIQLVTNTPSNNRVVLVKENSGLYESDPRLTGYELYRNEPGGAILVGEQHASSYETKIWDSTLVAGDQAYTYFIRTKGRCPSSSQPSAMLKTIHLSRSNETDGTVVLHWNPYSGYSGNYLVYAGNTIAGLHLALTTADTIATLPAGANFYQVRTTGMPAENIEGVTYTGTRSNLAGPVALTVGVEQPGSEMALTVYPNPFVTSLQLTLSNYKKNTTSLRIYDSAGALLHQSEVQSDQENIDLGHLPAGQYYLEVHQAGKVSVMPLIKN